MGGRQMGACTCDRLLVTDVPGDTIRQISFSVAVQQLEFHCGVVQICPRQADDGFFALTLLILGKTSGICHWKTMGSAPNDYKLQINFEFGCLVH